MNLPSSARDAALSGVDSHVSLLALDQYYRALAWMEPMTEQEEAQLFALIEQAKRFPDDVKLHERAKAARDRLVERYQLLVLYIAKRRLHFFKHMELLDLVNEGSTGLMKAIACYDECPNFHGRFSQLAGVCIRRALWDAFYGAESGLSVPVDVRKQLSRLSRMAHQLKTELGREPSLLEVSARVGLSVEQVGELGEVGARLHVESLHRVLVSETDYEDRHRLVGLYEQAVEPEPSHSSRMVVALHRALQRELTPRQREVVTRYYGFGERVGASYTRGQVAEHVGIHPNNVNLYDRQARRRLREALETEAGSDLSEQAWVSSAEGYYTTNEACAVLGMARTTLLRAVARGHIPAVRGPGRLGPARRGPWRFPKEAIHVLAARRSAALPEIVA
jgi:RNA polymerase sigma factor (sigma-70 family)